MAIDEKYGRIFTEQDIDQLIEGLSDRLDEEDLPIGDAIRNGLSQLDPKIPADEPVFILRAQDAYTVDTIENYLQICGANNCSPHHLSAILNAQTRFREWQRANEVSVKQPD